MISGSGNVEFTLVGTGRLPHAGPVRALRFCRACLDHVVFGEWSGFSFLNQ